MIYFFYNHLYLCNMGYLNFLIFLFLFKDFSDGGAFPECHIAQYPLSMGKGTSGDSGGGGGGGSTSNSIAVQLDEKGKVKYDVLARQGHAKDKVRPFLTLNW